MSSSTHTLSRSDRAVIKSSYRVGDDGRYCIDNYDRLPAFSSFLPGVAGLEGVPLWCLYVNRGQGVISFGAADKDHSIAEFLPANWAYQLVGVQGFRTFCKVNGIYYEPFQNNEASRQLKYKRSMYLEMDSVEVEECNDLFGLIFRSKYFSPVNQPVPSLVRQVTIQNSGNSDVNLDVLDGLPIIQVAEVSDFMIKKIRRLAEAYCSVRLIDRAVPYYSPRVKTHDEAEVERVVEGNFYASWLLQDNEFKAIEPFVDPDVVFGGGNDLITPRHFMNCATIQRDNQVWENRLPCALVPFQVTLTPGKSVTLYSVSGNAPVDSMALDFLKTIESSEAINKAALESKALIEAITRPAFTLTSTKEFDAYSAQNFLDNVLRGGIPVMLPSKAGDVPLHVYTRRHGDLERDYNEFHLAPNPLSDGPGNFRDILQNRRHDSWFYPDIMDSEIRTFVSLLQADGYNPLGVEGWRWTWSSESNPMDLCPIKDDDAAIKKFEKLVETPFAPGSLLKWANVHNAQLADREQWLRDILSKCDAVLVAHGHDGGYWIDHWTYIVDMLEAFAAIYPDRVVETLAGKNDVAWFDDGAFVNPRSEKYVMRPSGPLAINAVKDIPKLSSPLPSTNVLGKLSALIAIRSLSFDYEGRGIEMEAGRPSWNDAMNGLPGLFGSSVCETAELARLSRWLLDAIPEMPEIKVPAEVGDLIESAIEDLENPVYNWDRAATLREEYREKIASGNNGKVLTISGNKLSRLLAGAEKRSLKGLEQSEIEKSELLHTYYRNNPTKIEESVSKSGDTRNGRDTVRIIEFKTEPLPLFLQGQMHWLRMNRDDQVKSRRIYSSVRQSGLFDKELQMYKLNVHLKDCPPEIGRARTFSRGWYENESIWVHMTHKYLIELLRGGLYDEFFTDAKTMMVPFMDPNVYGRSILENSSFIASSACPDPNARGRGFVARLSGTTAEFVHIWLLLTVGERPFRLDNGELSLKLEPVLPGAWFRREKSEISWLGKTLEIPANSIAVSFLGSILLIYRNDSLRDTYGDNASHPVSYRVDEGEIIKGGSLRGDVADRIRKRECRVIEVQLD